MNSKEVAKKLRCSVRRVTWLCQKGRITGAEKETYPIAHWIIPKDFKVLPLPKVKQKFIRKKPKYVLKPQKWTVL